jgi:hypothetical protein
VTTLSISTSDAAWQRRKQPTSGAFWLMSRTTPGTCAIGRQYAATSWPEAAAKARYVLNLYAASLALDDSHHRDLVTAILADFSRLSSEG